MTLDSIGSRRGAVLAERLRGWTVLEAGCGNGIGSAVLDRCAARLTATDKLPVNVAFASQIYPWLDLRVWDATEPWPGDRYQAVVAVEVLEHVADPVGLLRNLFEAAVAEVWFSTPNGLGKPRPPDNPYHVAEYTPVVAREIPPRLPTTAFGLASEIHARMPAICSEPAEDTEPAAV